MIRRGRTWAPSTSTRLKRKHTIDWKEKLERAREEWRRAIAAARRRRCHSLFTRFPQTCNLACASFPANSASTDPHGKPVPTRFTRADEETIGVAGLWWPCKNPRRAHARKAQYDAAKTGASAAQDVWRKYVKYIAQHGGGRAPASLSTPARNWVRAADITWPDSPSEPGCHLVQAMASTGRRPPCRCSIWNQESAPFPSGWEG
jgi:hypothetical protein